MISWQSLAAALADAFEAECTHDVDASAAEDASAVLVVDTGKTGNTIMPDGQMCDPVGRCVLCHRCGSRSFVARI